MSWNIAEHETFVDIESVVFVAEGLAVMDGGGFISIVHKGSGHDQTYSS
jgi:hypothetical protein